jgi:hypothetical protein
MKITVSKGTPKNADELRVDIITKLNNLAGSGGKFFSWNGDTLTTQNCANVNFHNKLVILLALFTDSNYNSGTYTQFYDPVAFCGYGNVEKLLALKAFVDSIPSLKDVNIELN